MNEPYKLIEKEYTWDEFYDLLQEGDQLIRIYQKYNDNYTSIREYDWEQRRIHFSDGKIEFFNGSHVDYKFEKQFNENILYGFGSFYLLSRIFDREETGEEEEYEGNDGMYYTRQIKRTLETYTLQEREVKIYRVTKFV
jgi:hypothetical protein